MSYTYLGSILALLATSASTVESMTSGAVLLSPPLLALVTGVRTAAHITISS